MNRGEKVKEERVEEKFRINKHIFSCSTKLSMYCDLYLQEKLLLRGNSCID